MQILLKNKPEDRRKLLEALEGFAREQQLPGRALQAADLALEEHLTNVMSYAYEDELTHDILVRCSVEKGVLVIEVEDDGKPFDPLLKPEVDINMPLEQRPIGGLGIHLMRRFMDEVDYRREAGKNCLVMRKRLAP